MEVGATMKNLSNNAHSDQNEHMFGNTCTPETDLDNFAAPKHSTQPYALESDAKPPAFEYHVRPHTTKLDAKPPALEYRDFCFSYDDTTPSAHSTSQTKRTDSSSHALSLAQPLIGPVNLTLPQGAFALLTGSTGVGKTTLLRCAKPEIAPAGVRTGETFVRGIPTRDLSPRESAEQIGYVQDNPEGALVCADVLLSLIHI